jgi:PAS domain S-box-containing protein
VAIPLIEAIVSTDAGKPKVLIVDDQPRNLDVLEIMLADADCTLVRATSADEALLCLVRHDFAALVLDIRMPEMSGIELARLVKQRKRSRHVPILFLTAHSGNEDDMLRGYGAGAVDYLSKPVNAEVLRSKIGVFVDVYRKTQALAALNDTLQREVAVREAAQAALQSANDQLEQRVLQRTTELMRAHQGVRENEERLRMAMDVARIAAWEWQLPTGDMTWSTDPEVLFGFPRGTLGTELRLGHCVHPEDRERLEEASAAALRTGRYQVEYRAIRPDGTVLWITERGEIVGDDTGPRLVGISRDVSAEREAAHERERLLRSEQQARDEAERQGRLKDEFLATLSHELRTPMNAILGWLSILESGKPIREIHAVLAVVRRNAELQARLIEDLLDMNRFLSGTVQLEMSPIDVGSLLQTTMQGLQPGADAKGVQVIASVEQTSGQVTADGRRLQQVLWNLVHNAVKFTPKGGLVQIHVHRSDGELQIQVQDNGQGINPSFLPHVFERFRQEDSSTTRNASGLGLGLSIAKQIVELHGGVITAFSDGENKGSTFTIRVPSPPVPPASSSAGGAAPRR